MQKISDDLNKMKGSFFVASHSREAETKTTSGDQQRDKIREWLSPPDPSINHNTACEAHHNRTAMWLLEGPIYNEWKVTGSLLWTHGNRMAFHNCSTHAADNLWFRSGIWQEHSLVRDISADLGRSSLYW
jgi:hypothetical protein